MLTVIEKILKLSTLFPTKNELTINILLLYISNLNTTKQIKLAMNERSPIKEIRNIKKNQMES